jgi:patatin-like phospholipase/acyl hydrolase
MVTDDNLDLDALEREIKAWVGLNPESMAWADDLINVCQRLREAEARFTVEFHLRGIAEQRLREAEADRTTQDQRSALDLERLTELEVNIAAIYKSHREQQFTSIEEIERLEARIAQLERVREAAAKAKRELDRYMEDGPEVIAHALSHLVPALATVEEAKHDG